jgi:hypothetical protein
MESFYVGLRRTDKADEEMIISNEGHDQLRLRFKELPS